MGKPPGRCSLLSSLHRDLIRLHLPPPCRSPRSAPRGALRHRHRLVVLGRGGLCHAGGPLPLLQGSLPPSRSAVGPGGPAHPTRWLCTAAPATCPQGEEKLAHDRSESDRQIMRRRIEAGPLEFYRPIDELGQAAVAAVGPPSVPCPGPAECNGTRAMPSFWWPIPPTGWPACRRFSSWS
jgi:hypothetical protein